MNVCEDCVLRLFNKRHHNLQGIGNPFMGKLIILPDIDYNAYKSGDMSFSKQVDIINQHTSFTGGLSETYILPLIRCSETIGCEATEDVVKRCLTYLSQDFATYNFRHIMLCGSSVFRFLNGNISNLDNKIVVSSDNRLYYSNYSPLIKYVNNELFDKFVINLNRFLNSAFSEDYTGYEIIKL